MTRPLVLVLEDDNAVRRSLQLLLEGRGFKAKAYAGAEALLADPAIRGADMLVTDYLLGRSDGISVLETLRNRGWNGSAILMTAFASDALTARAKDAGFETVLDKPFADHALVAAIKLAAAE